MSDFVTFHGVYRTCPYCGHEYQVESEDIDAKTRTEDCDVCGKSYMAWDEIEVAHYASRDCSLNREAHEPSNQSENWCGKCGMYFETPEVEQ